MKTFTFHSWLHPLAVSHGFNCTKTLSLVCSLAASMTLAALAAVESRIVDAGPNHRVWQSVLAEQDALGAAVFNTNSFTELSSGINYWNEESGQYEESRESFEITPEGYAVARKGPYRLIIAPNINEPASADLWRPGPEGGKRFRSNPMGLSFRDWPVE